MIEKGSYYLNHKLFKKIVNSNYNEDLIYLDSYELYCDEKYCYNFTKEGKLIYIDHGHFTYEGSKIIGNEIIDIVFESN